MDANRLQLAAALKARPQLGQPQTGGQMTQQGYAQRPGIPTRQGMPQQPMNPQPGFGGGGMQAAPGNGGPRMFDAPPAMGQQPMPPELQQAMGAMRGAAPQFGGMNPQAMGGKPSMGAGGRPMPRPMR